MFSNDNGDVDDELIEEGIKKMKIERRFQQDFIFIRIFVVIVNSPR